jgi:hypothetical protein
MHYAIIHGFRSFKGKRILCKNVKLVPCKKDICNCYSRYYLFLKRNYLFPFPFFIVHFLGVFCSLTRSPLRLDQVRWDNCLPSPNRKENLKTSSFLVCPLVKRELSSPTPFYNGMINLLNKETFYISLLT